MNNWIVLAVAGLPLAAALLGYAIRKSRDGVAYFAIASLLASAGAALFLLSTMQRDDRGSDVPHQFTFGSIALPSEATIRSIEANVPPEDKQRYLHGIGAFLAENPAVQAMPLRLSAGRAQLLFAATTALIAALCLLFALWERRPVAQAPSPVSGEPRTRTSVPLIPTLTLFAGAMLLFICADTLLLIYLAWELMGLCSFLLIAYPGTQRARRAAREAFWTTRATDFGLLLAVIILMGRFGWMTLSEASPSIMIEQVLRAVPSADVAALVASAAPWFAAATLLVLLATVGKMAMFPLSFWLAEAMVAPPPVSALLHAATMVAAGPFLLIQLKPLLINAPAALAACALVAGVSVVLTGLMALAARDAKRVLAYSTISQLSIVVLGVACVSSDAALFHLLAHAWYKAPLFLTVGYLAIAASTHRGGSAHVAEHSGDPGEGDDHTLLTRLSGAARGRPLALATLLFSGIALAGIGFGHHTIGGKELVLASGGWAGKDQILLALLTRGGQEVQPGVEFAQAYPVAAAAWDVAAVLLLLAIPITAAYTARLVGILAWGRRAGDTGAAGRGWAVPMAFVAFAALLGGLAIAAFFKPFKDTFSAPHEPWRWIEPSSVTHTVLAVDLLLVLGGIFFAILLNVARPAVGAQVVTAGRLGPLIDFFAAGMRLREFWHALVGRGGALLAALAQRGELKLDRALVNTGRDGRRLAMASAWVERHIVDGLRYWGAEIWWLIRRGHQRFLQTGSIQHYMLVILLSAVLLSFLILRPLAKAFKEIFERMG